MFNQFRFDSIDDCLESSVLKVFFSNLTEQIAEMLATRTAPASSFHIVLTIKLPDNYCTSEGTPSQYCMFV
jgi:hypothetical protein